MPGHPTDQCVSAAHPVLEMRKSHGAASGPRAAPLSGQRYGARCLTNKFFRSCGTRKCQIPKVHAIKALTPVLPQDKFLRINAEFDNFRKRSTKEKDDAVSKAKARVIEASPFRTFSYCATLQLSSALLSTTHLQRLPRAALKQPSAGVRTAGRSSRTRQVAKVTTSVPCITQALCIL